MEQASAAKSANHRVNSITGIHLHEVNPELLEQSLKALGIESVGDIERDVVSLYGQLNETVVKENRIVCAKCFALGDNDVDNCQFCGSSEAFPEADAKRTAAPQPELANAPAKADKKKQEAHPMTTETETTPKPNGKGKDLAKPTAAEPAKLKLAGGRSEADLDRAVHQVQVLKSTAATSMHKLGLYMMEQIYGPQLWKHRTKKDAEGKSTGKPAYKNVDAFVNAELGMTPQHAYKLMEVAKNYTPEQVQKFGTTKLGLLLEAPREERPRLQQQVEQGASKREVEAAVREANRGRTGEARGSDRSGKAKAQKPPKLGKATKAEKTITVAKILGTQKVKLWAKPGNVKNFDPKTAKAAKRLADVPYGRMELANDVTMHFTLAENAAGQLELKITTSRDD